MSFGEKLYNLRSEQGVFQKELATHLHISVSAISSYENDIHLPDLKTLGGNRPVLSCIHGLSAGPHGIHCPHRRHGQPTA